MKIYMTGTVSNGEKAQLLPTDIYMCTSVCDDNLSPSKDCIALHCDESECSCITHGNNWISEWQDVEVCGEDGLNVHDKEHITNLIKERDLTLGNMECYCEVQDRDVAITVTDICICDKYENEIHIEPERIQQMINIPSFYKTVDLNNFWNDIEKEISELRDSITPRDNECDIWARIDNLSRFVEEHKHVWEDEIEYTHENNVHELRKYNVHLKTDGTYYIERYDAVYNKGQEPEDLYDSKCRVIDFNDFIEILEEA